MGGVSCNCLSVVEKKEKPLEISDIVINNKFEEMVNMVVIGLTSEGNANDVAIPSKKLNEEAANDKTPKTVQPSSCEILGQKKDPIQLGFKTEEQKGQQLMKDSYVFPFQDEIISFGHRIKLDQQAQKDMTEVKNKGVNGENNVHGEHEEHENTC